MDQMNAHYLAMGAITARGYTATQFPITIWRQSMRFFSTRCALLGCLFLCTADLATAAPITWGLSGVTFDDQAVAAGSLTYDADTDTLLSYSIAVSSGLLPAFTYSNATANNTCPKIAHGNASSNGCNSNRAANELYLGASGGTRFLELYLASSLTGAGGTVPALTSGNFQSYEIAPANYDYRIAVSGSLSTLPEPGSWGLICIAGMGLLCTGRRTQ